MSNPLDSGVQEDVRTFPMYQYVARASDSEEAYDVKASLGLPFTSKWEASTSMSEIRI